MTAGRLLRSSPPGRPFGRALRTSAAAYSLAWLVGLPAVASAGPPTGGARYAQTWEQLNAEQRARALQNFQRYQRLPEGSRSRLERRYERFQGLPPSEQEQLRRNYDAYRKMTPDQRQELSDRYRRERGGRP